MTIAAEAAPPSATAKPAGQAADRLAFVDAMRGVAVVFMILWHTADSWIAGWYRESWGFELMRFLGGLAAPLFLLLAGAGVGLKVAADRRKKRPASETVRGLVARGLEIVVVGYALRFQFWLIDSAGIIRPDGARVWLPIGIAIAVLIVGIDHFGEGRARRALAFVAAGVALYAIGAWQLWVIAPTRLAGLLRVDVLQAIGVSLALVTVVAWGAGAFEHRWRAVALGVATMVATPLVWSMVPGPLPDALAAYFGKWTPPPGQRAASMFPIFPWMAYTFVGVALGGAWDRAASARRSLEVVVALAAVGAIVAIATSETLPPVYQLLAGTPWLTQPFRVTHRIGIALVLAPIALVLGRLVPPLHTLGRTSLLVYWVHLEFAFGIAATPLKRSLGPLGWTIGFAVLTVGMYLLALFRLGPWRKLWSELTTRARRAFARLRRAS